MVIASSAAVGVSRARLRSLRFERLNSSRTGRKLAKLFRQYSHRTALAPNVNATRVLSGAIYRLGDQRDKSIRWQRSHFAQMMFAQFQMRALKRALHEPHLIG